MEIDSILKEQRKKLQLLKAQRVQKQQELAHRLSSTQERGAKGVPTTEEDEPRETQDSAPKREEAVVNLEAGQGPQNLPGQQGTGQSPLDVLPQPRSPPSDKVQSPSTRVIYTKTVDTTDLRSKAALEDIEEYKKQLEKKLEKSIRAELESKYRKSYNDEIEKLKELNALSLKGKDRNKQKDQENPDRDLKYPTTKVKQLSMCDQIPSRFLSLHDDCVCIWTVEAENRRAEPILTNQVPLFSQVNHVLFDLKDPNKIITAGENGYVQIYDVSTGTRISSMVQLNPLISVHQTLTSLVALTVDGDFVVLAYNLIDQLIEKTNIFSSIKFTSNPDNKKITASLNLENIVITTALFINSNTAVLALLTGDVLNVDFGSHKITSLYKPKSNDLPIMSMSYNAGKLLLLGLNHTVKVLNLTPNIEVLDEKYISSSTFSVDWISPASFVTCSIEQKFIHWDLQNDKIHKKRVIDVYDKKTKDYDSNSDDGDASFDDTGEYKAIISDMKVLNKSTVLVGDLSGKLSLSSLKR